MKARGLSIATGLALLFWLTSASAYCTKTCDGAKVRWPIHEATFQLGKKSFSDTSFRSAVYDARDAWNQSPGFFTVKMVYPTYEVGLDNGYNEIWFSTNQDILEGAPGTALTWHDCPDIDEVDIVFDANFSFTASMTRAASTAYGGTGRTFSTAATHEVGHALGICHNNYSYNIMGDDSTFVNANGDKLRNYAGGSGIAAEIDLYGIWSPSQYEDVSVVHWKYAGADGEYSTHMRTTIYDLSDDPLAWVSCGANNMEPCYKVSKGQTVKVEFTYENLGKTSPRNVDVGYYMSTNSLITTLDTLLFVGNIPALGRRMTTNNTFIKIPDHLTSGRNYYIGAIVNPNRTFLEATGANNATYIGIQVE